MIESRQRFSLGDRIGRATVAKARIVATVVHGYTVIVEVISSLGLLFAAWAFGPRLLPARAWTRGR